MTHDQIKEKLQDILDGTVTGSESIEIQNHLNRCTDCRQELAELKVLFSELESIPQLEPPIDFASTVMARVRSETAHDPVFDAILKWLPKFGYAYAFGSAIVIAILSKFYLIYETSSWSALSWTEKLTSVLVTLSNGFVNLSQWVVALWVTGDTLFKYSYPTLSSIWMVETVLILAGILHK